MHEPTCLYSNSKCSSPSWHGLNVPSSRATQGSIGWYLRHLSYCHASSGIHSHYSMLSTSLVFRGVSVFILSVGDPRIIPHGAAHCVLLVFSFTEALFFVILGDLLRYFHCPTFIKTDASKHGVYCSRAECSKDRGIRAKWYDSASSVRLRRESEPLCQPHKRVASGSVRR